MFDTVLFSKTVFEFFINVLFTGKSEPEPVYYHPKRSNSTLLSITYEPPRQVVGYPPHHKPRVKLSKYSFNGRKPISDSIVVGQSTSTVQPTVRIRTKFPSSSTSFSSSSSSTSYSASSIDKLIVPNVSMNGFHPIHNRLNRFVPTRLTTSIPNDYVQQRTQVQRSPPLLIDSNATKNRVQNNQSLASHQRIVLNNIQDIINSLKRIKVDDKHDNTTSKPTEKDEMVVKSIIIVNNKTIKPNFVKLKTDGNLWTTKKMTTSSTSTTTSTTTTTTARPLIQRTQWINPFFTFSTKPNVPNIRSNYSRTITDYDHNKFMGHLKSLLHEKRINYGEVDRVLADVNPYGRRISMPSISDQSLAESQNTEDRNINRYQQSRMYNHSQFMDDTDDVWLRMASSYSPNGIKHSTPQKFSSSDITSNPVQHNRQSKLYSNDDRSMNIVSNLIEIARQPVHYDPKRSTIVRYPTTRLIGWENERQSNSSFFTDSDRNWPQYFQDVEKKIDARTNAIKQQQQQQRPRWNRPISLFSSKYVGSAPSSNNYYLYR